MCSFTYNIKSRNGCSLFFSIKIFASFSEPHCQIFHGGLATPKSRIKTQLNFRKICSQTSVVIPEKNKPRPQVGCIRHAHSRKGYGRIDHIRNVWDYGAHSCKIFHAMYPIMSLNITFGNHLTAHPLIVTCRHYSDINTAVSENTISKSKQ